MPQIRDFRTVTHFADKAINRSGQSIGRRVYWKLYAIENLYRVVIHSVLSSQINANWWSTAADARIKNKAKGYKNKYLARPWHTIPGSHDIYYVDLYDLNEIVRVHTHLFSPIIEDIDEWIVKIESIRLPRNVVSHMNFPSTTDSQRIDIVYKDFTKLVQFIQSQNRIVLQIPR